MSKIYLYNNVEISNIIYQEKSLLNLTPDEFYIGNIGLRESGESNWLRFSHNLEKTYGFDTKTFTKKYA